MLKTKKSLLALTFLLAPIDFALANPLEETKWKLKGERGTTISFMANGRINAYSGCNRMFGKYTLTRSNGINIERIARTKKLCEKKLMDREENLINVLENAKQFRKSKLGLSLRLASKRDAKVTTFSRVVLGGGN